MTVRCRLEQFISSFSVNRRVHVPKALAEPTLSPNTCCYPFPALILHCQGRTEFSTPLESIELNPGDAVVMAAFLPHAEKILAPEREYANIYVAQEPNGLHLHSDGYFNRSRPITTGGMILRTHKVNLSDTLQAILRSNESPEESTERAIGNRLFPVFCDLSQALSEVASESEYG